MLLDPLRFRRRRNTTSSHPRSRLLITLINGNVQNAQNTNAAPLGSVVFSLTTDAQVIASPFGQVQGGIPIKMYFDATGNLLTTPTGINKLWSNLELNPQITGSLLGTAYSVNFYDSNN